MTAFEFCVCAGFGGNNRTNSRNRKAHKRAARALLARVTLPREQVLEIRPKRRSNQYIPTIHEPLRCGDVGYELGVYPQENLGLGLQSHVHFKSGSLITQYEGEVITKKKAAELGKDATHVISFGDLVIDGLKLPTKGLGGGSFVNHSKTNANAAFCEVNGKVFLRATKHIQPKEWIMCQYSKRYLAQMNLFEEQQ